MPTCFVIQPFDGGNFDNRYEDVFAPAIKDAGFDPYRVDRDPAVSIPIEDIQRGIKQAAVCLADITLDNPNVWFELGYALSAGKSVVMVCGIEREKFPFDVHHRSIIKYQTGSPRDFDALKRSIKERLQAIDKKDLALDELVKENPLIDVGGLSTFERIILATIVGNSFGAEDSVPEYMIKKEAEKSGLTSFATALALRKLLKKDYLSVDTPYDHEAESLYKAFQLTTEGWDWVIEHEHEFAIQRKDSGDELE